MNQDIIQKLDKFFESYPSHEYKKGEIIIQAYTEPTSIFYLESGLIRRYYLTEEGSEITLSLYKPHTFLPMSWAIGNVKNIHFYEAMFDSKAKRAPKEAFLEFLKSDPEIMYDLLRRIYIGMEGLWMHIESLTTGNSYSRLVASLVILGKRFGTKGSENVVVNLKLSENDLGKYAGISRETASRELQKLKGNNLVSFEKGIITIHNLNKLEGLLLY